MRNKDKKPKVTVGQKVATVRVSGQLKYQSSQLKKLREKVALARVLRKLKYQIRQCEILLEVNAGLRSDDPHLNQLAHRRIRGWMRPWGGRRAGGRAAKYRHPVAHKRRPESGRRATTP
jgi:hypothetical protein